MLDQKVADAMLRVIAKDADRLTITGALQRVVDEFGLGYTRGNSAYFSKADREEMGSLLAAKGYSITNEPMVGLSRSQRLGVTPNEKAGRERVKQKRVSVKAMGLQPLLIDGQQIWLPPETHLDADWTKLAGGIGHRCIMVVENYENFNRIHATTFDLPAQFESPLVVYRGDPHESRLDNVIQFLSKLDLPILAFVDIDPNGLVIANQFSRLAGVIAPEIAILEELLRSPQTGRRDLFQSQYPGCRHVLDSLPEDSPCRPLWDLISEHRAGLVQERWIGRYVCGIVVITSAGQSASRNPVR